MNLFLKKGEISLTQATIEIAGSKSESNRLLILQAYFPNLLLENVSDSDDTFYLKQGLSTSEHLIDIQHAGTAMRFLTAYYAAKEGASVVLKGSERMHQRPIGVLVDALRSMGAAINYLDNEGFPPLEIQGKQLAETSVEVMANISSQYISALLLIAPKLPKGLIIHLAGETTSVPYITMTLALLKKIGVSCSFSNNRIEIAAKESTSAQKLIIESDWSSASYFYSLVALSEDLSLSLKSYFSQSLQGDSAVVAIFRDLGVATTFHPANATITLTKTTTTLPKRLELNLIDTPDIAQTIAVTCVGLGISCKLTGLHTLKIKETDRLVALKTELEKLGANVVTTSSSLIVEPSEELNEHIIIETYSDHRMAMAFAPLAMKTPLHINDPNVVSKSFPTFWDNLQKTGILLDYK
jgi:3-phosphoshikimate 1-carboxyvinyltransferase